MEVIISKLLFCLHYQNKFFLDLSRKQVLHFIYYVELDTTYCECSVYHPEILYILSEVGETGVSDFS